MILHLVVKDLAEASLVYHLSARFAPHKSGLASL
jgi:hypothetical protein